MSGMSMQEHLDEVMAELRAEQAKIAEAAASARQASATVTSKDRAVEITVDAQGVVTAVKFPTNRYRGMAPAQLGALIVETAAAARADVLEQVSELYAGFLPEGVSLGDLMNGTADFGAAGFGIGTAP